MLKIFFKNSLINYKIYNPYHIPKFFIIIYLLFNIFTLRIFELKTSKKIKIGIIGLKHHQNIGNNLLKYAIYTKLSQFGFEPHIIGTLQRNVNISFIMKFSNVRIVNSFSQINEKDYDILMVNSDQTWRRWSKDFYDIAFLKFAQNWNINKFVYGTSLGFNSWKFSKEDEIIAKNSLKNFTGISVREKLSIKLIDNHLGIKPFLVLDPTLLIDKKYYLKIIKNYKCYINIKGKYIFTYNIQKSNIIDNFIKYTSRKLNYEIFNVKTSDNEYVEKFIFGIYNSKAVITNSYHGTLFSIIFNKPFISFEKKNDERFNSLKDLLGINERIFKYNEEPNINLLKKKPNINKLIINELAYFC